jgi:hypothetical protein
MKKYLLAFSMLFLVGVTAMDATPKHRHRHRTTTVSVKADSASAAIEVYSDTASANGSGSDSASVSSSWDDDDIHEDFGHFINRVVGHGPKDTGVVVIIVFLGFILACAPFLIFGFIIYYMVKRHNDRVKLSMKAMEMGQLPPAKADAAFAENDEMLWKKGVKNSALGLGLALMFFMFDAEGLAGVGLLVLCYGLGQVYMARASRKKHENKDENNHPEF